MISAINGTRTQQYRFIRHALYDLTKLENRPQSLAEMAYEWCSVICENHQRLRDWKELVLLSLEIGFRHLDLQSRPDPRLRHTEHHQKLVDVVFESRNSEAIADLLHAWIAADRSNQPPHTILSTYSGHLPSLHNLVPFSPRLRRVVIRSVRLIGYQGFEGVGVERFIELLNYLHLTAEDIRWETTWIDLLLETIRGPGGVLHLSHWCWELLVGLVVSRARQERGTFGNACGPRIMTLLIEAQEWSKLECWMGTAWVMWPPGVGGMTEEGFDCSMLLLFRQRPGAAQKLEQWIKQSSQGMNRERSERILESFYRVCRHAHEAIQQDGT
jgi:hypothetical protein